MADILSGFGGFGQWSSIIKLILWLFAFLVIGIGIAAAILVLLVKKNAKKIIEINLINKRMRFISGRNKKNKKGIRNFYATKLKRFLPKFQQKDIYTKGKQETVILVKDNNGMYHTARLPTWKETKLWYSTIHDIDLDDKDNLTKHQKKLRHIFLLPSPHEDLEWLANQAMEADKEFNIGNWWQSPIVAYIATGFICMIMVVATIVLTQRM